MSVENSSASRLEVNAGRHDATPNKPAKPVKPTRGVCAEVPTLSKPFGIRLFVGFLGMAFVVFVLTTVKRMLMHTFINTGEVEYSSQLELVYASEWSLGIAVFVLTMWIAGLYAVGSWCCRKPVNAVTMVCALSLLMLVGWVVPNLWVHGGLAGPTTAMRMFLIVPLLALGASHNAERAASKQST